MLLTKDQIEKFREAAEPLVKFLCENCHPHVIAIVEPSGVELVESICVEKIEEFIKD